MRVIFGLDAIVDPPCRGDTPLWLSVDDGWQSRLAWRLGYLGSFSCPGEADEGEGGAWLGSEATAGSGDVGVASDSQEPDGGVAEGGHDLGC